MSREYHDLIAAFLNRRLLYALVSVTPVFSALVGASALQRLTGSQIYWAIVMPVPLIGPAMGIGAQREYFAEKILAGIRAILSRNSETSPRS